MSFANARIILKEDYLFSQCTPNLTRTRKRKFIKYFLFQYYLKQNTPHQCINIIPLNCFIFQ